MKKVIDYIPKKLQSQPLFVEIADVIQHVIDDDLIELNDIVKKYRSTFEGNQAVIETMFKEFGYDYIYDILEDIEDQTAADLIGFIGLIHLFKGHKIGLQITLDLLGFSNTLLKEWWEETPSAEPDTFKMYTNILPEWFDANNIPKFLAFIKHYVYPILTYWEFTYRATISEMSIVSAGFCDRIVYGAISGEGSGLTGKYFMVTDGGGTIFRVTDSGGSIFTVQV